MKKWIALLLAVLMVMTMAACGEKEQPEQPSEQDSALESQEQPSQTEPEETTEPEEDLSDWGIGESTVFGDDIDMVRANIKFPSRAGVIKGTGIIAAQQDSSLVILDGELGSSPVVAEGAIDEILPTYFEQTVKIMDSYRKTQFKDFAFTIEAQELVEINGYTMCKYVGKHTYTEDDAAKSIQYVAYATQLKLNGACVYWMVLDESEDQSLFELIEDNATKMAYTLEETD